MFENPIHIGMSQRPQEWPYCSTMDPGESSQASNVKSKPSLTNRTMIHLLHLLPAGEVRARYGGRILVCAHAQPQILARACTPSPPSRP